MMGIGTLSERAQPKNTATSFCFLACAQLRYVDFSVERFPFKESVTI